MLKLIRRTLALGLVLGMSMFIAGCGGSDATIEGTYNGQINIPTTMPPYTGAASISISSANVVSGTWTATQGASIGLVAFTGTATPAGAFSASGYYGGSEVIRLTGTANAGNGVLSGTYLFISGATGVFSLAK